MPKVQIPEQDRKDSKKVVEHIQRAVQDQLSKGYSAEGGGAQRGGGVSAEGTAAGIYIKW